MQHDNIKVKCDCNTTFCFKCYSQPHFPLSCVDNDRWKDVLLEFQKRNELITNLLNNEKDNKEIVVKKEEDIYPRCPGCGILTEKTSGCKKIFFFSFFFEKTHFQ